MEHISRWLDQFTSYRMHTISQKNGKLRTWWTIKGQTMHISVRNMRSVYLWIGFYSTPTILTRLQPIFDIFDFFLFWTFFTFSILGIFNIFQFISSSIFWHFSDFAVFICLHFLTFCTLLTLLTFPRFLTYLTLWTTFFITVTFSIFFTIFIFWAFKICDSRSKKETDYAQFFLSQSSNV